MKKMPAYDTFLVYLSRSVGMNLVRKPNNPSHTVLGDSENKLLETKPVQ
jgi:hypothetical protein